jgi:uncharacterized protein YdaU (DUF1376 family)
MTENLPEPLTPADCDLRDFSFMPLDVRRLLDSEWWITALEEQPDACGPAINLWSASWHHVPAASLPDSELVLRKLAGVSRSVWEAVKPRVLATFIKCSDGRLYHPTVSEKANEAWARKQEQRERGRAGAKKRWGTDGNPNGGGIAGPSRPYSDTSATANATANAGANAQPMPIDSKGQGQGQGKDRDTTGTSTRASQQALDIIRALDQSIEDTFGSALRRPWPVSNDIVHATRWADGGIDAQVLYRMFLAAQQSRKAAGKDPAGSLAFFEKKIGEHFRAVPAGSSNGDTPGVRFMSDSDELEARKRWWRAATPEDKAFPRKFGMYTDDRFALHLMPATGTARPEIPAEFVSAPANEAAKTG